mmetsp:Transcript_22757/g.64629  ORF Transcript_22757/g.64629 Transcript_22757/m.64629 type:complete len:615 (+) Transcript_22757:2-1846(+)
MPRRDALSREESEKWVWKGAVVLDLGPGCASDRALIKLSPGGGDAVEIREFDLVAEKFLDADARPFRLPAAKTSISYKDANTVFVGSDFGPGSMTSSGYARQVKEWRRGQPIAEAKLVFEGDVSDVSVGGSYIRERGGVEYELMNQNTGFYSSKKFVRSVKGIPGLTLQLGKNGAQHVALPDDVELDTFADQLLVSLRSAWKGFAAGSLIAAPAKAVLSARSQDDLSKDDFVVLFQPRERIALRDYADTKSRLVLRVLDTVKSRFETWQYTDGTWARAASPKLPSGGAKAADKGDGEEIATVDCWPVESRSSELVWITHESFVQPTSLLLADLASGAEAETLKKEHEWFDAADVELTQHFATSLDGTQVPYFMVAKRSQGGPRPTLLYGYGGFEISLESNYQVTSGLGWVEAGNVYVCANIRGGGEFGPEWHQAALKANRNKAYEDFEGIARDLVARGVTTHKQLGCMGGSNGGLLTGNMLARSPELFGAIVIMVPLLDMKRFNKLLAGASWMAEYGNPDTDDWDNFLHKYSPYHNVDAARRDHYPPVLFTTSTRDDRVHPGHARKLAAKLRDMGAREVHYWENIEGGHGGASTNEQRAQMWTIAYQFLSHALA